MRVKGKTIKAPPSLAPEPEDDTAGQMVEPTPGEKRNGWTRETLTQYLRDRAEQRRVFEAKLSERDIRNAKAENTSGFDPHRWGR